MEGKVKFTVCRLVEYVCHDVVVVDFHKDVQERELVYVEIHGKA